MKLNTSFLTGATLFLVAVISNQPVQAQLTLTGTNYVQDFNAIGSGLPAGWSVRINATTNALGTVTTNYSGDYKSWGDSKGEFGNCASAVSDAGTNFIGNEDAPTQTNCLNRALAIRQTASFGDPGAAFVLQISNTIGLSNLTFSLDWDMLRTNSNLTTWTIQYGVGDSPSLFTTLDEYSDPGIFGATTRTYNLSADADNLSSNVWIRIAALSPAGGSGTRDTFGIDNFSLSWEGSSSSFITPSISRIQLINGSVQIDFISDSADTPSAFTVQCAGQISDGFADADAAITQTDTGKFHAECAMSGLQQFYRIKRP